MSSQLNGLYCQRLSPNSPRYVCPMFSRLNKKCRLIINLQFRDSSKCEIAPNCVILDIDKTEETILTEDNASFSQLMQIGRSMEYAPILSTSTCKTILE